MPLRGAAKRRYNQTRYSKHQGKISLATFKDEKRIPISIRLPEGLVMRVQRLTHEAIATGRYPFKTPTDTYKHLLMRGYETLKGDPVIDEGLPYIKFRGQLEALGAARNEAQGAYARLKNEVSELLSIGNTTVASQYVQTAYGAARKMPPTAWRDWLLKELGKTFPDLLHRELTGVRLSTTRARLLRKQAR